MWVCVCVCVCGCVLMQDKVTNMQERCNCFPDSEEEYASFKSPSGQPSANDTSMDYD